MHLAVQHCAGVLICFGEIGNMDFHMKILNAGNNFKFQEYYRSNRLSARPASVGNLSCNILLLDFL